MSLPHTRLKEIVFIYTRRSFYIHSTEGPTGNMHPLIVHCDRDCCIMQHVHVYSCKQYFTVLATQCIEALPLGLILKLVSLSLIQVTLYIYIAITS